MRITQVLFNESYRWRFKQLWKYGSKSKYYEPHLVQSLFLKSEGFVDFCTLLDQVLILIVIKCPINRPINESDVSITFICAIGNNKNYGTVPSHIVLTASLLIPVMSMYIYIYICTLHKFIR